MRDIFSDRRTGGGCRPRFMNHFRDRFFVGTMSTIGYHHDLPDLGLRSIKGRVRSMSCILCARNVSVETSPNMARLHFFRDPAQQPGFPFQNDWVKTMSRKIIWRKKVRVRTRQRIKPLSRPGNFYFSGNKCGYARLTFGSSGNHSGCAKMIPIFSIPIIFARSPFLYSSSR